MSELLPHVVEQLAAVDATEAEYAQFHFGSDEWGGDACGCSDDRCIGFHHHGPDDCSCLSPCLVMFLEARFAAGGGRIRGERILRENGTITPPPPWVRRLLDEQ